MKSPCFVVENTDTRLDTEFFSRRGCRGGRGLGGRGRGDAAGLRTHVLAVRRDGPHTWPQGPAMGETLVSA